MGHAALTGEIRKAFTQYCSLASHNMEERKRRPEETINQKDTICVRMLDWSDLAQCRVQTQDMVNTAIRLRVP
jgi:hypothetical protein